MIIRNATEQDIPRMKEIFAIARAFMAATGNPHQWAEPIQASNCCEKTFLVATVMCVSKAKRLWRHSFFAEVQTLHTM